MRLLSVDWDTMLPLPGPGERSWQLYDWGHREAPLFQGPLWTFRAASFLMHDFPLPGLSGEHEGFWDRFAISANAPLYVAESHAAAVLLGKRKHVTEIIHVDAHHDLGYHPDEKEQARLGLFACQYWTLAYTRLMNDRPHDAEIHLIYPGWRTRNPEGVESVLHRPTSVTTGLPTDDRRPIDAVFVCRSSAWMPPWLDGDFDRFVAAAPNAARAVTIKPLFDRSDFSLEQAQREADQMRAMYARESESVS